MTPYLGDYALAATLNVKFNTDVNGTPFTLGGTPSVSVWKQGSATPITAGVVLTVDYQSITGLHDVAIDLSDAAYATGKDFQIYLSAGSVNGISREGQVLAEFSIGHRSAAQPGDAMTLTAAYDAAKTAASQTSVDDLPTNAELATALGTADDAVLAAIGGLNDPSAADVADAVWEEILADHSGTAGSTAEALAAAGSAGDPWATALPGAYSAGQAGKIVGDNLNATVSSRATQTSVDDLPTNAELATALGTADDATLAAIAALTIPTANQNADALLDRANAIEASLTLREALRVMAAALGGKVSGAAGTTVTFRNVGDTKDRIVATVDSNGNRTAISLDVT